ncbi:magnesium transporter CorA family protein [Phenylobacterium deserti]|uniref:Magnesium transport protein CorA n=1 Tax=Phenylobacterium deserti TaxID=1914756 RepID=A0A328AUU5_9CAUL|nr:magnesium transporter CorA family protein [Phenylobacterium deserti]RAK57466.1 magnesium transporter [Phenylobacterium deserti]
MLNILRRDAAECERHTPLDGWTPPEGSIWIDLKNPTREEELAVERALGLDIPTREEMAAIEPSSRLYQENGATFMTATLLARSDEGPTPAPVTFVLTKSVLATIRYDDLRAFTVFADRAPAAHVGSGTAALMGLLDAIVERLADIIEDTAAHVQNASTTIFRQRQTSGGFQPLLTELARAQSVTSTTRNTLVSLGRMLSFAGLAQEIAGDPECQAHLRTVQADVQSLTEHSAYQATHIAFLLDAALGLINIEQNSIIKWFSVYAVIFLPPTLLASIWGMNFHHMPELDWRFGYPVALGLMVIAAVVPLWWFRKRGWL